MYGVVVAAVSEEFPVPPIVTKLSKELAERIEELLGKLERLRDVAASYLDSAVLVAAEEEGDEKSIERVRVYATIYAQVKSAIEYIEDAIAFLHAIPDADIAAHDFTVEDVIDVLEDRLGEIHDKKQRTTIDEWHATAYERVIEILKKRGDWG